MTNTEGIANTVSADIEPDDFRESDTLDTLEGP
jgi:hypothetical protein